MWVRPPLFSVWSPAINKNKNDQIWILYMILSRTYYHCSLEMIIYLRLLWLFDPIKCIHNVKRSHQYTVIFSNPETNSHQDGMEMIFSGITDRGLTNNISFHHVKAKQTFNKPKRPICLACAEFDFSNLYGVCIGSTFNDWFKRVLASQIINKTNICPTF